MSLTLVAAHAAGQQPGSKQCTQADTAPPEKKTRLPLRSLQPEQVQGCVPAGPPAGPPAQKISPQRQPFQPTQPPAVPCSCSHRPFRLDVAAQLVDGVRAAGHERGMNFAVPYQLHLQTYTSSLYLSSKSMFYV